MCLWGIRCHHHRVPQSHIKLAFLLNFFFPFLALSVYSLTMNRLNRGKNSKRNGFRSSSRQQVSVSLNPFPDKMIVRLQGMISATVTDSDTFTDTVLNLNNVFDPFAGVSSSQMNFVDNLNALYLANRVHASSIKVSLSPTGTTALGGYKLLVVPSISSTAFTTFLDAMGMPRAKFVEASPYQIARVQNQVSVLALGGLNPVYSDALAGTSTAGPSQVYYWHVITQRIYTTTNEPIQLEIQLEYDTEFYKLRPQTDSVFLAEHWKRVAERHAKKEESKSKPALPDGYELVPVKRKL